MTTKSRKLELVGLIIAALIAAGVALFIHFDSTGGVSKSIKSSVKGDAPNESETSSVTIEEIFVTPVSFDLPATFYMELVTSGLRDAKNFTLSLDFGRATIEKCSIKPADVIQETPFEDIGIRKIRISKLLKNESLYVSCLLSQPNFEKIIIAGGNLLFEEHLSFSDYLKNREDEGMGDWPLMLFIFFGIPSGLYIIVVFIRLTSRWLKLDWG